MRPLRNAQALILAVAILTLIPSTSSAANRYYKGVVEEIVLVPGGFMVTYDGPELDDCLNQRVYFTTETVDPERVERAFALAMVSKLVGETLGIVIDKDVNGPGGRCDVSSTTTQGAKLF